MISHILDIDNGNYKKLYIEKNHNEYKAFPLSLNSSAAAEGLVCYSWGVKQEWHRKDVHFCPSHSQLTGTQQTVKFPRVFFLCNFKIISDLEET